MAGRPPARRTAQLDTAERTHLETVVTGMRERIEDNVRFRLARTGLHDPDIADEPNDDVRNLVEAIELDATDADSCGRTKRSSRPTETRVTS